MYARQNCRCVHKRATQTTSSCPVPEIVDSSLKSVIRYRSRAHVAGVNFGLTPPRIRDDIVGRRFAFARSRVPSAVRIGAVGAHLLGVITRAVC